VQPPIIPFALLPMGPARAVSVTLTALLMLALGVGRAKLGQRPTQSTAVQTIAIAAAAGIAGLVTGKIVDHWFS
jgi:VIT1/CCC1 family predicted Fe2+/Mn2+ transporter